MPAKNSISQFLIMTFGTVLLTAGVYFFKIPNGFSTGGVSGIGTILGKVTVISPAKWISIINIALLIFGFIFLGQRNRSKNNLLQCAFFGTYLAF